MEPRIDLRTQSSELGNSKIQDPRSKIPPLIVIVGETGSGKSALALDLALKFNGEIICADSRTIYKGMDIGTAKPSVEDQALVPHHLLDIVTLDQKFSVADFKVLANKAINDIQSRGNLPILVGGTGLYIDSVIFDFQFSGTNSERDPVNPRHLAQPNSNNRNLRPNTLVFGLQPDRDQLKTRIKNRVDAMFEQGLKQEVTQLAQHYGWENEALKAVGYREFNAIDQLMDSEIKQAIITHSLQYAKRQRTWFKRNKSIHWQNDPRKVVEIVTTYLNKNQ
jgi:tRNA dimethylallyltransferase